MKAHEARILSEKSDKTEYKALQKQIKTAARKGERELLVYEIITEPTIKLLKRDGYAVIDSSDTVRNETLYRIKW